MLKQFIYIILLFAILSCNIKKSTKENILDFDKKYIDINAPYKPIIYPKYNKNRDTIIYLSIKYLNDSIPDSLYKYPIIALSIDESSITCRKDFFSKSEGLYFSKVFLNDTFKIDSTFKNLKYLSITNPRSVITNSTIKLDEFSYWVENDYGITEVPFSFNLDKMTVDSSMYIVSPNEEIIIPSDKKFRKVIFCTKNDQFERLQAEYEFVDTLYCHKMRERQTKAREYLRNERK